MKVHDYRIRTWGHDFTYTPHRGGLLASMTGWGPITKAGLLLTGDRIRAGDCILFHNHDTRDGSLVLYGVKSIEYKRDPSDMWTATVEYISREESLKIMETSGLKPEPSPVS